MHMNSSSSEQHPARRSGRLHLIDVENLWGGTRFAANEIELLEQAYKTVSGAAANDQIVLGCCHYAAPEAWFGWHKARRLPPRSGPNGAELSLIDLIDKESVADRFNEVVIGSGDGEFSWAAAKLHAAGVHVTVVSKRESLSSRLRFAALDVRYLDFPTAAEFNRPRLAA